MMPYTCANCGHIGSTSRKLADWEIEELRARAQRVMVQYPKNQRWGFGGRQDHLRGLADEYGINLRTLYRYMERAA